MFTKISALLACLCVTLVGYACDEANDADARQSNDSAEVACAEAAADTNAAE